MPARCDLTSWFFIADFWISGEIRRFLPTDLACFSCGILEGWLNCFVIATGEETSCLEVALFGSSHMAKVGDSGDPVIIY